MGPPAVAVCIKIVTFILALYAPLWSLELTIYIDNRNVSNLKVEIVQVSRICIFILGPFPLVLKGKITESLMPGKVTVSNSVRDDKQFCTSPSLHLGSKLNIFSVCFLFTFLTSQPTFHNLS